MAIFTRTSLALAFCVLLSGGAVAFELVGNGKPADASCYPILNDPEMPDDLRKEIEALPCIPMYEPPTDPETLSQLEAGQAAYDAEEWEKAYALLKPLADGGEAKALFLIAKIVQKDDQFSSKSSTYISFLRSSASKGYPKAITNLGYAIINDDLNIDNSKTDKAIRYYLLAASMGDHLAQSNYFAEILNRDKKKELFFLKKSAEQGYLRAQVSLGAYYHNVDSEQFRYWTRKAARQGDYGSWWFLYVVKDPEARQKMSFWESVCGYWHFWIWKSEENHACTCKNCSSN